MNRVTPQTPLPDVLALMRRDGYVLMENALSSHQVDVLSQAYNEQISLHPPQPEALRVDVPRLLERDERFEPLMDNAPVFAVARGVLGVDLDIGTCNLDHKLPRTPSYIGWHNDFQWMSGLQYPLQNFLIRCTYFISEVKPDGGPFTLLPGSHFSPHACPADENPRKPRHIDGQLGIVGPAGSCLINNTEIWHTNSANNSDEPRRLIMLTYKHAWMKSWQDGHEMSAEFGERQTDPLRRQLCGKYDWHHAADYFPANDWQPPVSDSA